MITLGKNMANRAAFLRCIGVMANLIEEMALDVEEYEHLCHHLYIGDIEKRLMFVGSELCDISRELLARSDAVRDHGANVTPSEVP